MASLFPATSAGSFPTPTFNKLYDDPSGSLSIESSEGHISRVSPRHLRAESDVFNDMLQGDFLESTVKVNESAEDLGLFLNCLFCDQPTQLRYTLKEAETLLTLLDKYQCSRRSIDTLMHVLGLDVEVGSAAMTFALAAIYDHERTAKTALKVLVYGALWKDSSLMSLPAGLLARIPHAALLNYIRHEEKFTQALMSPVIEGQYWEHYKSAWEIFSSTFELH